MSFVRFIHPLSSRVAAALLVGLATSGRVGAQVRPPAPRPDSARRDTTVADSLRPRAPRRQRAAVAAPAIKPPISPRRALLYSLALPGLGQSRLDRHATGVFFTAIEAAAMAMAAKSAFDLAEARAFRGDSLIATSYPVNPTTGLPTTTAGSVTERNNFSNALVRSRRLHLEDWLATIAFNHLISGAEAFVSANLWEVQTQISARPSDRGTTVAISLAW